MVLAKPNIFQDDSFIYDFNKRRGGEKINPSNPRTWIFKNMKQDSKKGHEDSRISRGERI
jgi:hypothetical protein